MARPMLVLGAMKSGTTTLHEVLSRHPDVEIVTEKEANSFHNPRSARLVAEAVRKSSATVAGEVSAGYLQSPRLSPPVDTVHDTLGNGTLLLAILREPFDRAVSHWRHWVALGWEKEPCEQALLREDSLYVAFSRYAAQLAPWEQRFGHDQVLALRMEDYVATPDDALRRLWSFLGLSDPTDVVDITSVHENARAERVARGVAGRIARSGLYRQSLRRVVPAGLREVARRVAASPATVQDRPGKGERDNMLRTAFYERVGDDLDLLASRRPDLTWRRR